MGSPNLFDSARPGIAGHLNRYDLIISRSAVSAIKFKEFGAVIPLFNLPPGGD